MSKNTRTTRAVKAVHAPPALHSTRQLEVYMEPLNLRQLQNVWRKVIQDKDARRALKRLARDGFAMSKLIPQDATFLHPNWADYLAGIPLVPYRASRRRTHRSHSFYKHRGVVRAMREFAANAKGPFCDYTIAGREESDPSDLRDIGRRLEEAAELVEKFLSWNWYMREKNPRNALIAELRWTVRSRTGKPHDAELSTLIDAAFRAAGHPEGIYIDSTTLDRIEKREKESRMKATARLRARLSVGSARKPE